MTSNQDHVNIAVLRKYLENVKIIRLKGQELKVPEDLLNSTLENFMQVLLDSKKKSRLKKSFSVEAISAFMKTSLRIFSTFLRFFMSVIFLVSIFYILLQYKPFQYFIQSKLQDFIYPGMKILRNIFLPLISLYPSLTNLYDESCLVVNPFFRVPDMPCPCEDVRAILNLTGEDTKREQYHSGIPYMAILNRDEVSWDRLKELYLNHKTVFDRDATHLMTSTQSGELVWSSAASFFSRIISISNSGLAHTHAIWRCNRMEPTRLLRSLFGIPVGEPSYAAGVSIEKIVLVDGPEAQSYKLPTTEGTTVFIQQASGSRVIVLTPASECKDKCSTVSVVLPPSHILWFSWWYWRASSLPAPGTNTGSIAYVGSYL